MVYGEFITIKYIISLYSSYVFLLLGREPVDIKLDNLIVIKY